MKVLLCHNFYQQAGGERVAVEQQLALLRRHGHRVVLYSRDNLDIRSFRLGEKLAFPWRTIDNRLTRREVRSLVERERPDVAHVHNVFPLISPAIYETLADCGVPIVQTVHNYRFLCPNGLFYTHGEVCERCKLGATHHAVRLRCYRSSYTLSAIYALAIRLHRSRGTFALIDRFIALTDFTARKLAEGGLVAPDKIRVLGNFLPLPLPEPASRAARRAEAAPYALFLGRLTEEKGVHLLVDAFSTLPEVPLKIAGDGPEAATLARTVAAAGAHHIELLGFRSGDEKWGLVRGAAFTVAPSLWSECFPFAVLESLACGVPALVAGHGGLEGMVAGRGVGLTHRPGDVADLRLRVAELAAAPERRQEMGERGRAMVESDYTDDAHYPRLTAIYDEAAR